MILFATETSKMATLFISGTDTGVGKTAATGWLAKKLLSEGRSVITQKLIQTGCEGISEDIKEHRRIMEVPLFREDREFITCPQVLKFPASPHIACAMEGVEFDPELAENSTKILESRFDDVLIEGVGGLLVPLKKGYLCADYAADNSLPVVIVGTSLLGGINRGLLALESAASRGLKIHSFICNTYFPEDPKVSASAVEYLREHLERNFPDAKFFEMGDFYGNR